MFKAIAQMTLGDHTWKVVICRHVKTFEEAERMARAYAKKYDFCDWVQVLDD